MSIDIASADVIRLVIEASVFVVLLCLSAFFSSSETSLFSLNAAQLEEMRQSKNPSYGIIEKNAQRTSTSDRHYLDWQ